MNRLLVVLIWLLPLPSRYDVAIGKLDGAAGAARFAPLEQLTDKNFGFSLAVTLMG
jgi:hypothetical protein